MENNKAINIPVTLKGINYLLWARLVKTALGGRGLWSHVSTGAAPKQIIKGEDGKEMVVADEDKWVQEDLMVLSLIQSSLDPAILESYSYCETTKELWETLYKVYGNVSNLTRVFELKRAINALSQGDMEFQSHFGKFRSLWAELELLRPHTVDPSTLIARREEDKVFGLLLTLNSSYNGLIKHILRAEKLPSLDEVCAQIQKEEGSVGLFGSKGEAVMVNQAEAAVANKGVYKQEDKRVLICDHCKKKGHMKDKCWILHPHLKPNKFSERGSHFMDARANFTNDVADPATPGANNGVGSAMASTSVYSTPLTSQDVVLKKSDLEALIKLFKENSEIRREPVENMKLRRAKEADQDICAIKMSYLTNQEESIHETGFTRFYTQQETAANWFHMKRSNGLKDIPFSSQRWPDLPYLEAHWFNQLQTRHWRPGETSNHSGDQSKHPGESETFLQCTSIHQIVQNQPRPYLPFFESKAINTQQLFSHQDWHDFYHYFCSKEVPKKLTYSLKPSRYKAIISAL
ncbi:hypothetical protein N665_4557s0001 [Sinapis alba]|nr:hypothetical protein N665_4557s0001 [Sinapis alba]